MKLAFWKEKTKESLDLLDFYIALCPMESKVIINASFFFDFHRFLFPLEALVVKILDYMVFFIIFLSIGSVLLEIH